MSVNNLSPIFQELVINKTPVKVETNKTIETKPSKIDKKKLVVCVSAAAGIAAIVIGGILYFKRGKGQKVNPNIDTTKLNPLTQPKVQPEAKKVVNTVDDNLEKMFSSLNNPKPSASSDGYAQTFVYTDKNSIENDLSGWIEKRKHAVMERESRYKGGRKIIYNVPDEIGLEQIKPHNYTQTSDIFIQTRLPNTGFSESGLTIIDDKLSTFNGKAGNGWINIMGDKLANNYGYQAGIDKDGKACVLVHFGETRQDCGERKIHTFILMRAKNEQFNQDQLDLINMFEHLTNEEIGRSSVPNPLGLSFLVPEKDIECINTEFEFNKNTFLSIIKHFADKHSDFVSEVTQGKTAQRIIT